MRYLLCLVCAAGAIYTTPRAAKREAVEKAAESARGAEAATADGVEPVLENDVSLRDQDLTQRRFDIGVALQLARSGRQNKLGGARAVAKVSSRQGRAASR